MKSNCPRCEGTGQCVECKGTGKVTCPTCQGTGKRTTPNGTEFDCKTCKGTGQIDCALKCDSCQGTGVITDKLQKQVREKYTARFANFSPLSRMTTYLVVINLFFFILTDFMGQAATLYGALANNARIFSAHEYWRLLTPVFLHVGIFHVGLNCYYLWQNAPPIEGAYGSHRFLWLYFFSAIVGNLVSWLGHVVVQNEPGYASVGASTALFGIGTAYVALYWRWNIFDRSVVNWWLGYMGILLVGGFGAQLGGFNLGFLSSMDNWGHLGGALGGLLFVYLSPRPTGH